MQFKDMISLNELKSRLETARKGSINLRLTESTQTNPNIKKKKVKKKASKNCKVILSNLTYL